MTHSQACRPCAKRKVKCDLGQPCSNCKRRKTDKCVYPTVSPDERIKRLEALVKRLGGDPDTEAVVVASSSRLHTPIASSQSGNQYEQGSTAKVDSGSSDPAIVNADGRSFYLESRAWTNWIGDNDGASRSINLRSQLLLRKHPPVFENVLAPQEKFNYNLIRPSWDDAMNCYCAFIQNVDPVSKVAFVQDFTNLRVLAIDRQNESIPDEDSALLLAIYLAGIRSMTEKECSFLLKRSKESLMFHYRGLFETLLAQVGMFCIDSIRVFQAVMIYMIASFDLLNTRSLWSLMGLLIRSAERMGLHRDGTVLGLSPYETEVRRRVWWQLQAMDLFLSVRSGATSMSLMADWDVKMPLNIEDCDMNERIEAPPEPRKGLTVMSFCLFGYEAIYQQRRIFHSKNGRFNLSWSADPKLTPMLKESVIVQLEDKFNEKFLRFCDPIKPIQNFLQLLARSLIADFRLRVLHPLTFINNQQEITEQRRMALLDISMQCLRYNVAMHSKLLKPFRWRVEAMFPWHALMCVLVEASRIDDLPKAQEVWDLLSDVYANNKELHDISEDRRRFHAAELVVAAWRAWQNKPGSQRLIEDPTFVEGLEKELTKHRKKSDKVASKAVIDTPTTPGPASITPHDALTQEDFTAVFDLDFQDIDWSFWDNVD